MIFSNVRARPQERSWVQLRMGVCVSALLPPEGSQEEVSERGAGGTAAPEGPAASDPVPPRGGRQGEAGKPMRGPRGAEGGKRGRRSLRSGQGGGGFPSALGSEGARAGKERGAAVGSRVQGIGLKSGRLQPALRAPTPPTLPAPYVAPSSVSKLPGTWSPRPQEPWEGAGGAASAAARWGCGV